MFSISAVQQQENNGYFKGKIHFLFNIQVLLTWQNGPLKQDWKKPWIKDSKYKDLGACLGSINNSYWLSYVYFIVLGGASVPTNKFGCPSYQTLKWTMSICASSHSSWVISHKCHDQFDSVIKWCQNNTKIFHNCTTFWPLANISFMYFKDI